MKISLFGPILLIVVFLMSCKKDKNDTAKPTITGTWRAVYQKSPAPEKYLIILRSDSTLRIFNSFDTATATIKSEGTWNYSNNAFGSSYNIDANHKFMYGTVNTELDYIEGYYGAGISLIGKVYAFRQ